jgi:hypothetical protein
MTDISYNGLYYVVPASGGYFVEQTATDVSMISLNQIAQYDVTNSVQVKYSRATFNDKLGAFQTETDSFANDSITISASDFVSGVADSSYVISVGGLKTIYSDFASYVNSYFAYANGFETLFNKSSTTSLNNGVFDSSAFITLINGSPLNTSTGELITDLSGDVNLVNVNAMLKYIIYQNTFSNRVPGNPDPLFRDDKFVDGDLIYVPYGINVTLILNIAPNGIDLTYLGSQKVLDLNAQYDSSSSLFSRTTSTTITPGTNQITQIKQDITLPLLIRITDFSL